VAGICNAGEAWRISLVGGRSDDSAAHCSPRVDHSSSAGSDRTMETVMGNWSKVHALAHIAAFFRIKACIFTCLPTAMRLASHAAAHPGGRARSLDAFHGDKDYAWIDVFDQCSSRRASRQLVAVGFCVIDGSSGLFFVVPWRSCCL